MNGGVELFGIDPARIATAYSFFLFLSNSEKLKNQPICERRTNRIKREISVFTLNKL